MLVRCAAVSPTAALRIAAELFRLAPADALRADLQFRALALLAHTPATEDARWSSPQLPLVHRERSPQTLTTRCSYEAAHTDEASVARGSCHPVDALLALMPDAHFRRLLRLLPPALAAAGRADPLPSSVAMAALSTQSSLALTTASSAGTTAGMSGSQPLAHTHADNFGSVGSLSHYGMTDAAAQVRAVAMQQLEALLDAGLVLPVLTPQAPRSSSSPNFFGARFDSDESLVGQRMASGDRLNRTALRSDDVDRLSYNSAAGTVSSSGAYAASSPARASSQQAAWVAAAATELPRSAVTRVSHEALRRGAQHASDALALHLAVILRGATEEAGGYDPFSSPAAAVSATSPLLLGESGVDGERGEDGALLVALLALASREALPRPLLARAASALAVCGGALAPADMRHGIVALHAAVGSAALDTSSRWRLLVALARCGRTVEGRTALLSSLGLLLPNISAYFTVHTVLFGNDTEEELREEASEPPPAPPSTPGVTRGGGGLFLDDSDDQGAADVSRPQRHSRSQRRTFFFSYRGDEDEDEEMEEAEQEDEDSGADEAEEEDTISRRRALSVVPPPRPSSAHSRHDTSSVLVGYDDPRARLSLSEEEAYGVYNFALLGLCEYTFHSPRDRVDAIEGFLSRERLPLYPDTARAVARALGRLGRGDILLRRAQAESASKVAATSAAAKFKVST